MTIPTITFKSRFSPANFIGLRLLLMYRGLRKFFWTLVFAAGVAVAVVTGNWIFFGIVTAYLVVVTGAVIISAVSRKDRVLYDEKTITMTDESFSFTSAGRHETYDWEKGVSEWRKEGPYHIVYYSTGGFTAIPKGDIPHDLREDVTAVLTAKASPAGKFYGDGSSPP